MAKQILTQELLYTLFDYREGNLFWKKTLSNVATAGSKAGTVEKDRYIRISIEKKDYYAHRIIYMMFYGYMPKIVDHIDGNKQNNNISNLRAISKAGNALNSKVRKDNTSGVKGVTWNKAAKKWQVQLHVGTKYKYFGVYFDLMVAKFVADAMRHKYHGEFMGAK